MTPLEYNLAMELVKELVELGIANNLDNFNHWCYDNGNELYEKGYWWEYGLTKACIGHDSLNGWILKVGFSRNGGKDYATIEYEIYCAAEEAGLSVYFPETRYLCAIDGIPFYIQKEAYCDESRVTSDWYGSLKARHEEDGDEVEDDSIWSEIDDLHDDEVIMNTFNDKELLDFLMENQVGDFHEGNFGYINDRMVIVDFSGYNRV